MHLESRFWQLLEPSPKSYSNMIERLLGYIDESDLAELVAEMENDTSNSDEDEE